MGAQLREITDSASSLLGLAGPSNALTKSWHSVLSSRLSAYYSHARPPKRSSNLASFSEDQLRFTTANEATVLLSRYLETVEEEESSGSSASSSTGTPPAFGQRDTKTIGILSGIVGHWGLAPLLPVGLVPTSYLQVSSTQKFQQLSDQPDELENMVKALLRVVLLPAGVSKTSGRGQLAALVLPHLLLPLVASLVWLDLEEAKTPSWVSDGTRRLFAMNTPVTLFRTLIGLLSSAALATSPKLKPRLSTLLFQQLLRPTGVRSLIVVLVGNSDEDLSMDKLEMLRKLLASPGGGHDKQSYFQTVVPQLIAILQASADAALPAPPQPAVRPISPPMPILRATAYVLSNLILSDTDLLLPYFHSPLTPSRAPSTSMMEDTLDPVTLPFPLQTVLLLSTLIAHAPPLPNLIYTLITPLLPLLMSLSDHFQAGASETAAPVAIFSTTPETTLLKDEVAALLAIYAKSVELSELLVAVPRAIETVEQRTPSERGYWARTIEGEVVLRSSSLGEMEGREGTEMSLKPDTVVAWLKDTDRKELSSKLFLRWLSEVKQLEKQQDQTETTSLAEAKRLVMRLQLVLKMVDELKVEELVKDESEILEFVVGVLEPPTVKAKTEGDEPQSRHGLAGLKIVVDEDVTPDEDEEERGETGLGKDELILTAVTLLLAVLEGNDKLDMETTPLLQVVNSHLEVLAANSSSVLIPPLAREARLVLAARQASSLSSAKPGQPENPSRTLYLSALKLLQDPLLPVRAQGLAQLRTLIDVQQHPETDPALLPAILDIFIQALEDDDSFLYLSAVQGLSSLVDRYGRQMAKRLVEVYAGRGRDVGNGERGRRELDKRLRMGEALVQVVQRAGEALAVFVNDLVPTLLLILRTSSLPTPLRSSSLTILATCIEIAPVALLPYVEDLAEACVTLLSLESRPFAKKVSAPPPPASLRPSSDDSESEDDLSDVEEVKPALGRNGKLKKPEETPNPTSTDAQHPALRRSALLFLALLFRSEGTLVSSAVRKRAKTVLGYVEMTDQDGLVRHQAGEVLEGIDG